MEIPLCTFTWTIDKERALVSSGSFLFLFLLCFPCLVPIYGLYTWLLQEKSFKWHLHVYIPHLNLVLKPLEIFKEY